MSKQNESRSELWDSDQSDLGDHGNHSSACLTLVEKKCPNRWYTIHPNAQMSEAEAET